ncbi:TPA: hypothetical protein N3D89_004661 [Salmonella enterica subsp. enterica serovar Yaba]|nr:hypothetical protein [Salmonella enterica subsp. enterica serovar Yaba]
MHYDFGSGWYLCTDPAKLAGGIDPYGDVSNPLKYIDPLGLYTLYRAVFENEYNDARTVGHLRKAPMGYEFGKLFATTYEDAYNFGTKLSQFEPNSALKVLTVEVPDHIVGTEFYADGMKAVSIDSEYLDELKILDWC